MSDIFAIEDENHMFSDVGGVVTHAFISFQ